MEQDKKPESQWEESEQLGPYRLHEQVSNGKDSGGELYRATHETSGAQALVLKPAAGDKDAAPPGDWEARLTSSSSPGYLALEVPRSRWAVSPDTRSVEVLTCALEDVREGVRRMALALFGPRPRPREWILRVTLASVFGLCALMGALLQQAFASPPPRADEVLAQGPAQHEVQPTFLASGILQHSSPQGGTGIAEALPKEPFKGQMRPPCVPYTHVEINGACWVPHAAKPPCPVGTYLHEGKCYMPIFNAAPPPQATGS